MQPVQIVLLLGMVFLALEAYLFYQLYESLQRSLADWQKDWKDHKHRLGRQERLDQLDDLCWGNASYSMLKRLTGMAPLLGVLVTVFLLKSPLAAQGASPDPSNHLNALEPLYYGVALGAFLALFNQCVIQAATVRIRALRNVPRNDVLKAANVGPATASVSDLQAAMEKLQKLAESLSATADRLGEKALKNSRRALTQMTRTTKGLVEQMDTVAADYKASGELLKTSSQKIQKGVDDTNAHLQKMSEALGKSTQAVTDASKTCQTTIVATQTQVSGSLKELHHSTAELNRQSQSLADEAARLRSAAAGLRAQAKPAPAPKTKPTKPPEQKGGFGKWWPF